jgi:hypothetical protein
MPTIDFEKVVHALMEHVSENPESLQHFFERVSGYAVTKVDIEKRQLHYTEAQGELECREFLDHFTCNWEDAGMAALEIVNYMLEKDKMPEGISIWEPFEHYYPSDLVKEYCNV